MIGKEGREERGERKEGGERRGLENRKERKSESGRGLGCHGENLTNGPVN